MPAWWRRLAALFRRSRIDRELRDELDVHLEMAIEDLIERGYTPETARAAALRSFGNRRALRESAHDSWRLGGAETLLQDLRYAGRWLRRAPGFSLTAIAIVALGMGATAASFTLLDRVLLRPLPFAHPERLVLLHEARLAVGVPRIQTSPANYLDWKSAAGAFDAMGAYVSILFPLNLAGRNEPQRIDSAVMTGEMFDVLGVPAAAGRLLTPADDRPGAPDTVLLSEELARTLFGSSASAVGQTVRLDNRPHTVVGVMPYGFAFPSRDADVWLPLRFTPQFLTVRSNPLLYAVGRLRPGATLETARAELALLGERLERAYPKDNGGSKISAIDLRDMLTPQSRLLVVAIFASSVCLLLIACTNLANLLVARAIVRRREMAVRMAMGAGRSRIVRQLLTENALLVSLGGAAGLALAVVVVPLLGRLVPVALPVADALTLDWRAVGFSGLLVAATSVIFGLGPAIRSWRTADLTALRVRAATQGGVRLRKALVLAEVTGSIVLLIGAGLLVKSLWRVQALDPGFGADDVIVARTALPMPKYARSETRQAFYQRVLDGARAFPGVIAAAYTSYQPMEAASGRLPVTSPGFADDPLTAPSAVLHFVTPGFFDTLRVPLTRGRDFTDRDDGASLFVAIVSERLAERLWPGRDPIGQRVFAALAQRTVVGVAADIAVRRLEGASDVQIYFPAQQLGPMSTYYAPKDLLLRTSGHRSALGPAIEKLVHGVDPEQAVSAARPMTDILAAQSAPRRDQAVILGLFAALAFAMAAIGLHGVLSYAVSSRTQEIGVRVALGADRRDILSLILRQGVLLGVAGVAAASPLAYATARAMRALLYGVEPGDPAIYAGAAALALLMTLAGSLRPALAAARLDPAVTIRAD